MKLHTERIMNYDEASAAQKATFERIVARVTERFPYLTVTPVAGCVFSGEIMLVTWGFRSGDIEAAISFDGSWSWHATPVASSRFSAMIETLSAMVSVDTVVEPG